MTRLALQFLLICVLVVWTASQWLAARPVAEDRHYEAPAALDVPNSGVPNGTYAIQDRILLSAYPETLMRPIFFPGRRFPASQSGAAPVVRVDHPPPVRAPPAIPVEQIKFLGVIITSGSKRALIKSPGAETKWFELGESVDGWTISSIDGNTVILSNGATTSPVTLYSEKPRFDQWLTVE